VRCAELLLALWRFQAANFERRGGSSRL